MANEFIVKNGFKSQGDSEVTGSFTATSGMSGSFSGSFQGDGSNLSNVSLPNGVVSGSAQISYTGITDVPSGIISSSAQIASDISGSFGAASASFSTRVTANETNISTLTAATASYILASQTSSMSVATASYVEQSVSSSFASTASYVNTLSQQVVISDSTTSELLRITQTGTGDAIRIEDTSNPDATPTVINNAGDMFIGSSSAPESGGGNSPKLYVKNGSSGYTGNLAIDTAMLFEGAGSTYFATLSPDNSFGGLYMGSPSDVFGAFIRWRHDDARLQLGAAKTNHGIEFTVGNKGATSMQLKPDATGTGDYNATLTITGSLIVSGSNSQINTTGGDLISNDGSTSLRWTARRGLDSSGVASLEWQNRLLINGAGVTAINWSNSYLADSSGRNSVLWDNRSLYDFNGTASLFWDVNKRFLNDNNGNIVLNWTNPGQATFEGTSSLATTASYAISASHLIGGGGGSDPAININANGTTLTEVTSDSDLPTTLAANTTYLIRGNVSTGKTLNVTNAGTSVIGIGRNQSHLSYTGSNELFNVHDQSFSIKSLTMKSSGSIMTAKNVSPGAAYNDGRTKVLDIKDCQVKNTNNVMEVHGFELVDLNNVLFWYITGSQGLSFQSVRHLEISSCEFYNWYDETDTGSFAPAGTKMVEIRPNTGSVNTPVVNINSSIFHPEQSQIGLYIDSGSETLFGTVASNTFIDVNGGTLLAGSNYDSGSMLKYDIGLNQGLEDSTAYLYGYQTGTDAQGATTSYTQISISSFSTDIETRMSASTSGITYVGTKPIDVMFQINAGVADIGSNNEQFDFALYKNTNIINGSERRIELDSGEEGNVVTFALTNIVQNDLLTVYYKSPTNDGFTLQNFSIMIKE